MENSECEYIFFLDVKLNLINLNLRGPPLYYNRINFCSKLNLLIFQQFILFNIAE